MQEEPKPASQEHSASPPAETASPQPEVVIKGSDITAYFFGGIIFFTIVTVGVMNILAATGKYNPMHWKGRFWTGVFMLAAPTIMAVLASLPARIRTKMPDSVAEAAVLLVWVAFFWAACGGH